MEWEEEGRGVALLASFNIATNPLKLRDSIFHSPKNKHPPPSISVLFSLGFKLEYGKYNGHDKELLRFQSYVLSGALRPPENGPRWLFVSCSL